MGRNIIETVIELKKYDIPENLIEYCNCYIPEDPYD